MIVKDKPNLILKITSFTTNTSNHHANLDRYSLQRQIRHTISISRSNAGGIPDSSYISKRTQDCACYVKIPKSQQNCKHIIRKQMALDPIEFLATSLAPKLTIQKLTKNTKYPPMQVHTKSKTDEFLETRRE